MELLKKLVLVFAGLWLTFQIIGMVVTLSIVGWIVFEVIRLSLAK
jgi:hypothetical protein